MQALPFLALGALGGSAFKMLTAKSPEVPSAPPPPSSTAAQMLAGRDAELRRRRGQGANMRTGDGGAEATTPGGKVLLGT